jgi:hypothetical protein
MKAKRGYNRMMIRTMKWINKKITNTMKTKRMKNIMRTRKIMNKIMTI